MLGWAGLAMLARMSWAGWAGQVRLAGLAFILSPVFLLLVLWLVFEHLSVVVDAVFELWFSLGLHLRTLLRPLGDHLDNQLSLSISLAQD